MSEWILSLAEHITGQAGGSTYVLTRWIFLRGLGLIYLVAYLSLLVQVKGLVGENGILPIGAFLKAARPCYGLRAYWRLPTIFWFSASDRMLRGVCAAGVLCALLVIFNIAPLPALVVLWMGYLSLIVGGQDFLAFQWDVLLIETGFLGILFAPGGWLPGLAAANPPSPIVVLLLWWLIFRLMFESGVVKLTCGDRTWRTLTALHYHFYTQPLPTWIAWYAHNSPSWFLKVACVLTYVFEIALPLLIWGTHETRILACAGMVFFQLLIMATGNYNFFNLLAVALCLVLLDDSGWSGVFALDRILLLNETAARPSLSPARVFGELLFAICIFLVGGSQVVRSLLPQFRAPGLVGRLESAIRPLFMVNPYGLFRHMTTSRPEIVVEGSKDGITWEAYEFKYSPTNVFRKPGFVQPHQPRLDWQVWFAGLSNYYLTPWFENFLVRLLQGRQEVLGLLAQNPFPESPPREIRAALYDYTFTTYKERRETKAWWKRRRIESYSPLLTLRESQL